MSKIDRTNLFAHVRREYEVPRESTTFGTKLSRRDILRLTLAGATAGIGSLAAESPILSPSSSAWAQGAPTPINTCIPQPVLSTFQPSFIVTATAFPRLTADIVNFFNSGLVNNNNGQFIPGRETVQTAVTEFFQQGAFKFFGVFLNPNAVTLDTFLAEHPRLTVRVDGTLTFQLADFPHIVCYASPDPRFVRAVQTWVPAALYGDGVHTFEIFLDTTLIFGPVQATVLSVVAPDTNRVVGLTSGPAPQQVTITIENFQALRGGLYVMFPDMRLGIPNTWKAQIFLEGTGQIWTGTPTYFNVQPPLYTENGLGADPRFSALNPIPLVPLPNIVHVTVSGVNPGQGLISWFLGWNSPQVLTPLVV